MRRITALLASLVLLLTLAPVATLAAPSGGARDAVLVVFRDSVANPVAAAEDLGRRHAFGLDFVYQHALKGFAASVPSGALNALARDPRVAWVEPDQPVQLYQTTPTGVQRIFADDNPNLDIDETDDERIDVDIAIIDTGIDLDHPDLNVVASTKCLYSSGGPPFSRTYTCGAGGDDDNDHGTHVAGSAAALDNGIGVVGVAPGARLWAVKVLDANGSGSLGAVTAGIDYVTANAANIEVANMSLGCECSSAAMDTAIANSVAAGVTYAVAAGNSDADAATHSPANHDDVITVSALADFNGEPGGLAAPTCRSDIDDTLADFSNFGANIEIAAPGVCILSTVPGGGLATFSGTSMASPHVAGAAALRAATAPGDSPAQIRTTLRNTGNLNWTDDSGDGIKEPLLDVSNTTVYNPATVGSGGGEPGNTPPVATDDPATTDEGVAVNIDVLVNDSDADGDPLGVTNLTQPENGTSVLNVDGTVTYTPTSGFSGSDSFTYTANDGLVDSNVATVSVTVDASGGGGDPTSVTVAALTGSSTNQGRTWTASATVTITDDQGNPISGALVGGSWSNGTTGTGSCSTNISGQCTVSKASIAKNVGRVTFTVTSVTGTALPWDDVQRSATIPKP